jgi:hypothetical protein
MFQTEEIIRSDFKIALNFSTNRHHRLSNVKRKQRAVLAKPQGCKPDTVYVFRMAWD